MDEILKAALEDYRAGQFYFPAVRRTLGTRDRSLVEPVIMGLLATAAVGGVITDPGATFWAAWHGGRIVLSGCKMASLPREGHGLNDANCIVGSCREPRLFWPGFLLD